MQINELLKLSVDKAASDIHLVVPNYPVFRINGKLIPQIDLPKMSQEEMEVIFKSIASAEQIDTFHREMELDFAYSVHGLSRFRVAVALQRGTLGFIFRRIPFGIPTMDALKLPPVYKTLVMKPRGLILVTGPTGSGKSSTMAAMISYLNEIEERKVLTIEDPIEFLYRNNKCVIVQREVGSDTRSFSNALVHALRQDPDVIVVGEMRDLNTISTALRAAETGHLVMGTLHTTDAPQTIDRIIDVFPSEQQQQVKLQLSQSLEAVLSQTLVRRIDGGGRAGAYEIMVATPAVRNLIREGKISTLNSIIELGKAFGMQTLNQSLAELVKNGTCTLEEAATKSSSPENLLKLIQFLGQATKNNPALSSAIPR